MEENGEAADVQGASSSVSICSTSSSSTYEHSDILAQILEEEEEYGEASHLQNIVEKDHITAMFTEEEIQNDPTKRMLWAAENNKPEIVYLLLLEDPLLVHARDSHGCTPLHRAANNDHTAVADMLLVNSADVNARTNDGWEPLHCASHCRSIRVTFQLLQHGADINCQTNEGRTPLQMACRQADNIDVVELLLMWPDVDARFMSNLGQIPAD